MFVSHPGTVTLVREMERRALLAEAAEARRIADARRPSTGRPAGAAPLRRRLGLALATIGRRPEAAGHEGQGRTATAEIGAVS